ncbi:hypothetical protein CEXT_155701 [Caerostris extrusa]|uniref:Uncharacterized protein n=1 Tax=Caerostris extrusa TaxID=172846 RepID=A0AAV4MPX6_CAEEX|nr:hypothetical protein CEXT_155701 [Caerostris extrusa]
MVRIFRAPISPPNFLPPVHANPGVSVLEAVTRSILGFCWCTSRGSVRPLRVRCHNLLFVQEKKRRRIEAKEPISWLPDDVGWS